MAERTRGTSHRATPVLARTVAARVGRLTSPADDLFGAKLVRTQQGDIGPPEFLRALRFERRQPRRSEPSDNGENTIGVNGSPSGTLS